MNGKQKSEPKVDDKPSQNGKLSTPSVTLLLVPLSQGNSQYGVGTSRL